MEVFERITVSLTFFYATFMSLLGTQKLVIYKKESILLPEAELKKFNSDQYFVSFSCRGFDAVFEGQFSNLDFQNHM